MNYTRFQSRSSSPVARLRALLPSPACGRGVGGEGAFAFLKFPEATKRFRAPVGARVTFSLRGQRESNQRERPPRLALAGRPARQVREAWPGFSSGLLPARKGEPIRGLARCAAWSSPPHRRPGAPEKQARIVRARSNSKSRAPLIAGCSCSSEKCAPEARCSTRGPYGAAGGWRKVRGMARMDASQFFAGTRTCRRKTPEPARAPGRQDAWRARHRGVVSSCLLLLWTSKGEVTRAPTGARNRSEIHGHVEAKAPLTPTLSPKLHLREREDRAR